VSDEQHEAPRWLKQLRAQPSPAPWYVDDALVGALAIRARADNREIAIILDACLGEDEANAYQIAASGEMRDSLLELLELFEQVRYSVGDHSRVLAVVRTAAPALEKARRILEKARGRS
jgi:hypothetical protein